jgi:regulatory protein
MPSPPSELPPLDLAAQKTYERALDLISLHTRSARQLAARLVQKGEPAAQVEAVIARLCANGLVDDGRYAEARARAGIVGKARSRRRTVEDLVHHGVSREVADAAIRQVLDEEGTDEVAVAVRAAKKKMRSLATLDPPAQRQKLYTFLARQGHAADVVRRTLRLVLDASPPDEADD